MDDYNIWGRLLCRLGIHSWVYDRQGDYILKTCVRCPKQKKKKMKKLITTLLILLSITAMGQTYKAQMTAYNTAMSLDTANLSQGLEWNQSTDTYKRLGSLKGIARNASAGDANLPIQSRMRGCVLNDQGRVVYYLNKDNWDSTAGNTAASVLTGADGQVMVEIPKFYYYYDSSVNVHSWRISLQQLKGFTVHPAFIKDGVEVNYRYIGAYEGVLYDVSGSAYTDGNASQVKDFTATTGDKLSSISGKLPVTNGTRANFRTIAKNRGAAWRQLDYDLVYAIELLMLVEYGSFYVQNIAEVGPGISNVSDWFTYNNYYPIAATGNGNAIGGVSGDNAGATACATEATKYSKYRGIENFYGHILKWVDGINVNSNKVYVTNVSSSWADNTSTGYIDTGITLKNSDGWQTALAYSSRLMLPTAVGGASTTHLTDYYWQASGWRVALFGGGAGDGADGGGWYWYLKYASSYLYQHVGGRLVY